MRKHIIILTLFLLSFTRPMVLPAQDNKPLLSEEVWETERSKYLFIQKKKAKKKDQKDKESSSNMNKGPDWDLSTSSQNFIVIGLIILFLGIVGMILLRKGNQSKTRESSQLSFNQDHEKNLLTTDILSLLDKAQQEGNPQQIIRFAFLDVLKKLEKSNLLTWKREFTISQFNQQLNQFSLGLPFYKLSKYYEKKWYDKELSTTIEAQSYVDQCQIFNDLARSSVTNPNHDKDG